MATAQLAGQIHYLAPLDRWKEEKPRQIQGEGQAKANISTVPHDFLISDMRNCQDQIGLEETGFEFLKSPTTHDFLTEESMKQGSKELEDMIKEKLQADRVHCFSYSRRMNRKDHPDPKIRQPSIICHIDQTPQAAMKHVRLHMGEEAEKLLKGRYQIINVWRPLFGPLEDCPLALCDSRSLQNQDLVKGDYIYRPIVDTENFLLFHNPYHQWYYLKGQMKDEILMFKIFDSHSNTRTAHTGFENPSAPATARARESVEMRFLVFHDPIAARGD